MAGLELMISTILCNTTLCEPPYNDTKPNTDKGITELSTSRLDILNTMKEINGKSLKIGTYNNTPLSGTAYVNGSLVGKGVSFIIMDILSKKYNFTYEVLEPNKNYELGGPNPEDSLIGLLNSSKIDMAAALLPPLLTYKQKASFSMIVDEGVWVMMLKRPKESAAGSGLLAPFNSLVWYLVLAAVVTFAPCITFLTRLRSLIIADGEGALPLSPSFWFVYSAFLKQGTSLSPEANTTRVLFVTWWIFMILLSAFYTANLTAFLTLSKFTLAIEYPKDLYEKNYRWISSRGSSVEHVVKSDNEDLYYLSAMVNSGRAVFKSARNDEEFLSAVQKGAVLVKENTVIEHLMYNDYISKKNVAEDDRCTYVIAPNEFMKKSRAFAYPRGSPLKDLFDITLTKIFQSGILEFLKGRYLPKTKICPLDLQSKDRKLWNSDLIMTYMVMGVGSGIAIAVFAAEIVFNRLILVKFTKDKTKIKASPVTMKPQHYDETEPPPYDMLFGKNSKFKSTMKNPKIRIINGREYYVFDAAGGGKRLIPVRAPSSFLYRSEK